MLEQNSVVRQTFSAIFVGTSASFISHTLADRLNLVTALLESKLDMLRFFAIASLSYFKGKSFKFNLFNLPYQ